MFSVRWRQTSLFTAQQPPARQQTWATVTSHLSIFSMKLSRSSISQGLPLCYVTSYDTWLLIMGSACSPASHLNTPLYIYDLILEPRDGSLWRWTDLRLPRESTWRPGSNRCWFTATLPKAKTVDVAEATIQMFCTTWLHQQPKKADPSASPLDTTLVGAVQLAASCGL